METNKNKHTQAHAYINTHTFRFITHKCKTYLKPPLLKQTEGPLIVPATVGHLSKGIYILKWVGGGGGGGVRTY